ncbi:MAG: aminotransferase class I/II-fold pyridoxal phosphate-dependent enzyme [Cytophagales bacterium]|nr:MAG: aminotransferase class I/II-fold pyridoxal phosphate-dependent enzyme [Cytophagales bacterium]
MNLHDSPENQSIIPLSTPHLTGHEYDALQRTPPTQWPALVTQFEETLSQTVGAAGCLATHSGTAALELALRTLGVGTDDRVVCPTLTFSATANAITNCGATPIFVGSEPTTWALDPDALETLLKTHAKRPKAIIVVDLYGMPARWHDLQALAERFGVPLVADAAESLGSSLNGRACGTLGLLNAVSFNQNKIITASGGGAMLTNDAQLLAKARVIANQGRQTEAPYEQLTDGGNYRLNPVTASVATQQLQVLPQWVAQRRAIFADYQKTLSHLAGIKFQPEYPGAYANRWLTTLTIDPKQAYSRRDQTAQALKKAGIETRPVFWSLHRQQAYRDCMYIGDSLADQLAQTGLCLPSGSNLTSEQRHQVVTALWRLHSCPNRSELQEFDTLLLS